MRVTVVRTGVVRAKRSARGPRRYVPGGWGDSTRPVQAFAIEHPAGVCLFDTGQRAAVAPLPGLHPYLRLARFELGPEDEAARAVDPAAVRWVVLSHLHTDHVGGIAAFQAAEILVARGEWERAHGLRGRLRGYVPHHWPDGVEPRLIEPSATAVGPFGSSYDIAGDGTLLVVPLAGHTPDHVGLLVRDGVTGWLLAGDASHDTDGFETAQPAVAAWCAEVDVTVLLSHDPAVTDQLATAGVAGP